MSNSQISEAPAQKLTSHEKKASPPSVPRRGGAFFVGLGIFLSRIAGLVRERVFAHYFGNSEAADAFKAALKIPNFLQNLFGEGVLSASFIPVYARLLGENNEREADRVASVIATLLALITSVLAVVGVWLTPFLIDVIAPGFEGQKKELTIQIVQILFPGVALLVMSAWCLGVLNSHRRFFLSYVAPVLWNIAIIASIWSFGGLQSQDQLAITAAWGLVLGSFLQFAVQVPTVWRLMTRLRPVWDLKSKPVRTVLGSFTSVVTARGVVQISAYIDNILASLLPTGAVAALAYAQTLYLLPVSLFGMSVSAASLPEMARLQGEASEEGMQQLRARLGRGLEQITFYIVPSMTVFFFLGDLVVAALFKTGRFSDDDVRFVWYILAASAPGLLAATLGRLYASTFYALQDARSPLRFACLRVLFTVCFGYVAGLHGPRLLGVDASLGTVGITLASGLAAWIEFLLLRNRLNARIGKTGLSLSFLWRVSLASTVACLIAGFLKFSLGQNGAGLSHPIIAALIVFSVFGAVYFFLAGRLGLPQADAILKRLRRR